MSAAAAPSPWIAELFAAIDRRDAAGFAEFLTEDASFRFGNAPPVCGREAIVIAIQAFFDGLAGLGHGLDDAWELGDTVVCCGEVTYERPNATTVTLPFADIFRLRGTKISAYQIYMDINPLFAGDTSPA